MAASSISANIYIHLLTTTKNTLKSCQNHYLDLNVFTLVGKWSKFLCLSKLRVNWTTYEKSLSVQNYKKNFPKEEKINEFERRGPPFFLRSWTKTIELLNSIILTKNILKVDGTIKSELYGVIDVYSWYYQTRKWITRSVLIVQQFEFPNPYRKLMKN